MARMLRGNRRGQTCELHQWANDWFTVDFPDRQSVVASPTSLELDDAERERWRDQPNGMDREFELTPVGRFTKRST